LLAEKSRLAQENSTYARENRFLREVVDFHQFSTARDVVSLGGDGGDAEDDDPGEEGTGSHPPICTEDMLPLPAVVGENPGDEEQAPPTSTSSSSQGYPKTRVCLDI
jgi:hypothetical protein